MKLRLLVPFTVLAIAVVAAIFLSNPPAVPARTLGPDSGVTRVRVAPVEATESRRAIHLSGTTRAERRARVAFETAGRLLERRVDLGDRFSRGDLLARLDPAPFDLAVRAAEASLTEADERLAQLRRDRTRSEELVAAGAATREELEQVTASSASLEASRAAAEARLDEARRQQREAVLRAPFTGIVSQVEIEPGERAVPGRTVLELSGDGAIELEAEAPETLLPHLLPDTDVAVELPLQRRRVEGRVTSVGTASNASGLFPVRVSMAAAPGVLPGVTAELIVEAASPEALTVPLAAVIDPSGGNPSLFRVRGETAERITLEVDGLIADRAVIVASQPPLAAGDVVIIAGQATLRAGEAVEVAGTAQAEVMP
ncbi:MAG: efflux RND transporter periplasmic adaptor subunit [Acidobacteriota bacterium]